MAVQNEIKYDMIYIAERAEYFKIMLHSSCFFLSDQPSFPLSQQKTRNYMSKLFFRKQDYK